MSRQIKPRLQSTTVVRGGVRCGPQPLTGIDIFTSHMGIPIIQVYHQGLDLPLLQRSLQAALARYPLLGGRMHKDAEGLPWVEGTDSGVNLRLHRCEGAMPVYGPGHHMGPQLKRFHTPIYPWNVFKPRQPLFNVDVYRFDSGGDVLSVTGVHSLMDGTAFWQFMKDWSALALGQEVPDRPMERDLLVTLGQTHAATPYPRGYVYAMGHWERLKVFARLGWQHLFTIDKGVFRIPAATIERWKQEARAEFPDTDGVTTAELVTAHCLKVLSPMWRDPRDRCLGLVIDLRYKRRLRVPRLFFGNALCHGEVMYTAQELADKSLAAIAVQSRMPADSLTTEDLQGYLGLMETARRGKQVLRLMMRSVARTLDGGLVLNNCSHYPMYDIDLGTGRPSWHDATRVVFRMLMIIPTPEQDGGMDLHLTATRRELDAFRRLHS